MVPRAARAYKKEKDGEAAMIEEDEGIYCGLDSCRPSCMQGCASMGCMTGAMCFAGLVTSTLNIYINSQITTLERQFGFSSSVSGILLSCNDLGYLLTTLVASYMTRRVHIPHALFVSTLLYGLSGLLCAVPFFATRGDLPPTPYSISSPTSYSTTSGPSGLVLNFSEPTSLSANAPFQPFLCALSHDNVTTGQLSAASNGAASSSACQDSKAPARGSAVSERSKDMAVALIAIGMVLQGFGKSPRLPFIGTYVDDNVPKTKTTLYMGIISTVSMFGPMLAYGMGGFFSRIYVTLEATSLSMMDPRWVGAWWLGFLMFGTLGVLAAIPILFFPKKLQPQPELRLLQHNQKLSAARHRRSLYNIRAFAGTMLRLFRTPVYVLTSLGTFMFFFGISGTMAFHPKYLETQFQIPVWKANTLIGSVCAVGAAGGTLLGGLMTSRLKLRPVTCLKLMVAMTAVTSLLAAVGLALGCDQPAISHGSPAHDGLSKLSLIGGQASHAPLPGNPCSSSCSCDHGRFFPVCGRDGITYFSPCHAGCTKAVGAGYGSCSCIQWTSDNSTQPNASTSSSLSPRSEAVGPAGKSPRTSSSNKSWVPEAQDSSPSSALPDARPGFCDSLCGRLYPYLFLSFCFTVTSSFVMMPSFQVIIRSVSELDKPLAIGFSAFLTNLFGWFLGPIVHGKVIDSCCLLWSLGCSRSGSCKLYDIVLFRYRHHLMFICAHLGAFVAFGIAIFITVCRRGSFSLPKDSQVAMAAMTEVEGDKLVMQNGLASDEREPTGIAEETAPDGILKNNEPQTDDAVI